MKNLMSGKKKAARRDKTAKAKACAPARKRKPTMPTYVYEVLDANHPKVALGLFENLDAARDAIRAQKSLHMSLQTPAPGEVSEYEISLMAEGEPVEAPREAAMDPMTQFEWTVIVRRSTPSDIVFTEW